MRKTLINDLDSFSKFYDWHKEQSDYSNDTKYIQSCLQSNIFGKLKVSDLNYKLLSIMSIFLREEIIARNEDVTYSIVPTLFFEQLKKLSTKKKYFVLAYTGDAGNLVLDLKSFQVFLCYGDLYTEGYDDTFIDSHNRYTCYLNLFEFVNDLVHFNVRSSFNFLTINEIRDFTQLENFNISHELKLANVEFDYSYISMHETKLEISEFNFLSKLVFVDDVLWNDKIQLLNLIDIASEKPSKFGLPLAIDLSDGSTFYTKDSKIILKNQLGLNILAYSSLMDFYEYVLSLVPSVRGLRYGISETLESVESDNPFE